MRIAIIGAGGTGGYFGGLLVTRPSSLMRMEHSGEDD